MTRTRRGVPGTAQPRAQRGLSLVELLVALVLGLVLVGGVLSIYLASQQGLRTHQGLARLQESARLALDLLAREIRTAGVSPCGSPLSANLLVATATSTSPTPWWADTHAGFLRGGEASDQGILPAGTAVPQVPGTDSLLILRTSDDEGLYARVLHHDETARTFSVAASEPSANAGTAASQARIDAGATALVCDALSGALFQVDTVQPSTGLVGYANGPRNCSTALGRVDPVCGSAADKTFPAGAMLVPWEPAFWYVASQGAGRSALYRAAPDTSGTLRTVERVPGVEDLQIEYLTRDRSNGAALASRWVHAGELAGQWSNPAREVAALRLTLTLRHDAVGTPAPLRRVFRAVVALRSSEP